MGLWRLFTTWWAQRPVSALMQFSARQADRLGRLSGNCRETARWMLRETTVSQWNSFDNAVPVIEHYSFWGCFVILQQKFTNATTRPRLNVLLYMKLFLMHYSPPKRQFTLSKRVEDTYQPIR